MNFTLTLTNWYQENQRNLPWRHTDNPYYIWLSEIILQQTRVNQGLSYYNNFINEFPTVKDLALADISLVLKMWQGLGYYSRAKNLHETAKYIHFELNDIFPKSYQEIVKLKGIGPYTAAAIASFAYREPIAVVDGNVFRVFSRFFGIYDDIAKTKNRAIFQELGNELIDKKNPDIFNQALMDFGATLCKPKKPLCEDCPFSNECYAFRNNKISILPVKSNNIKIKDRYFHYLISENSDSIYLKQRLEKDIWQDLYEFPLLELSIQKNIEEIPTLLSKHFHLDPNNVYLLKTGIVHKLSHQNLHLTFWKAENFSSNRFNKFSIVEAKNKAFPIILWNEIMSKY